MQSDHLAGFLGLDGAPVMLDCSCAVCVHSCDRPCVHCCGFWTNVLQGVGEKSHIWYHNGSVYGVLGSALTLARVWVVVCVSFVCFGGGVTMSPLLGTGRAPHTVGSFSKSVYVGVFVWALLLHVGATCMATTAFWRVSGLCVWQPAVLCACLVLLQTGSQQVAWGVSAACCSAPPRAEGFGFI